MESNGNGATRRLGSEEEESGSGASFVDAPSAFAGEEEEDNSSSKQEGSPPPTTTESDVLGFETDGDALHLRYSSILRGAMTMSPSPSRE